MSYPNKDCRGPIWCTSYVTCKLLPHGPLPCQNHNTLFWRTCLYLNNFPQILHEYSFVSEWDFMCSFNPERSEKSTKNLPCITRKQTFFVVIPKEGLAGPCHTQRRVWVWYRLQNIIYLGSRVIFHSRCHIQRRIGEAPARQSLLGYDKDKDLKVCFLVTRVIYQILPGTFAFKNKLS